MSRSILSNQQLQALVDNLTTRAPKTSFTVAGQAYIASKVVTLARSVLTARAAIAAAKGSLVNARQADLRLESETVPVLASIRITLASMLSNDASALADLAVSPRKARKTLSAEERLTITEKIRATRTARGTMGAKAKAKVKGNVTGVVVTPVTSQGPVVTSAAAPANGVTAAPASPPPLASPPANANIAAAAGVAPASSPVTANVAAAVGAIPAPLATAADVAAVVGTPVAPGH